MMLSNSFKYALCVCAGAALLAGCGGGASTTFAPGATSGSNSPSTSLRVNSPVHPDRGRSWMSPDAKKSALLYVSDSTTYDVYVFSYPKGKLVGTLTNQNNPAGLCADKKGHVFVTQLYGGGHIVEYAHGGTSPLESLSDPGYEPGACSVDPTTGDLAVANIVSDYFTEGNLMVFPNASGTPTSYSPPSSGNWFSVNTIGYDNKGNVFFAGSCNSAFCAGMLSKGSGSAQNVSLNESPKNCGTVQWDGKYMTFDDQTNGTVYRYTFKASSGTEVSSTTLNGSSTVDGSWISGKNIVAPQQNGAEVLGYKYPKGGSAMHTITGMSTPFGTTISLGKKK
ncbi:MAG TPA: hypothetical protein VGI19_02105 [Candidatus Cybelea sp.]|jgi:hypothetical protein